MSRCCDSGASFNARELVIAEKFPLKIQVGFRAIDSVELERFQKILRELQVLRHDRVELQYLISKFRTQWNLNILVKCAT
ncbi:hypothetical protein A0J61_09745 [Choanephora cucurbitarum]|uniref:Uncharacterized protein n=1 Tax=Choanephora cucurbitarum TaxID=101091 RepID=A0A1C7MZ80_9FUNG|nr:hypothetical protein A0J61_09745 [Choanephora cucurbitarum]